MKNCCSEIQIEAIHKVRALAKLQSESSANSISEILASSNIGSTLFHTTTQHIKDNAKVVIHFHPDKPTKTGRNVIESLLDEGVYRNQFETGISNGGLSAFQGGERDEWEKRLFGGVYQKSEVARSDRPKYGALDLLHYSDGASPRFGSCYFQLKQEITNYCSFTFKDSYYEPQELGCLEYFDTIMLSMLREVEKTGEIFGHKNLTISSLLEQLSKKPITHHNFSTNFGRLLDEYIEAQIHSSINLDSNVEKLVADSSFIGTDIENNLIQLCEKYNICLDWHAGFYISVHDVPDDFRGEKMPFLAKRISGDEILTAATIGCAAKNLYQNPKAWEDWGTPRECNQYLKQLWHVLVRYGKPLHS